MISTSNIIAVLALIVTANAAAYPNVIFHGIGDSCDFAGMAQFTQQIGNLTGQYTKCIVIGSVVNQSEASWFTQLDAQGLQACETIQSDPNLNGTFNVVGLSQGGVLARYIVEKCNVTGRVSRFLSIAGPHMGVNAFPQCAEGGIMCDIVNGMTRDLVYTQWIQANVAPAGYFKDMQKYAAYLADASFLPDLNNERTDNQSQWYFDQMVQLDAFMLVMFENDTVLDPPTTAWFSYFAENGTVVPMEQQQIYIDDWIGLKTLNEADKLTFIALPGNHLQFTEADVIHTFVPFLLGQSD